MPTAARTRFRKMKKNAQRASKGFRKPAPALAEASAAETCAKTADSKGRVVIGGHFANRQVLVERLSDTEVLVKLARVIPEREAWLYENPTALSALRKGLAQARAGELNAGPDLHAEDALIQQLED